tara:strand:- start:407 stop:2140 length:1734 start_codon:yes stop_codon:yes gene_type:complete
MALTLNKQTENFSLDQGATFIKTFTAKNTAGGNVVISSGTTAAKLRQSIDSSNNIHTFSTSISGSNVTISMTATDTANISEDRRYVYDIEFTQSDTTTVEKIVEGVVTISPHAGDREFPDIITESVSDGQWGNTKWTDFVRNDGSKDRLVVYKGGGAAIEWGDSGEDRWWQMEGPHHEDIEEMKGVVVAEGEYSSHEAWDQALMRLVEYPNTFNSNTSTWSTGSYAALSDGEARSGDPFTVCSVFSSPFNPKTDEDYDPDNHGTIWAAAPYHSSRSRGGGWRLQTKHNRLSFQIGHFNRNQDNYNRVDGYLKPEFGVSANVYFETHNPDCYQDPFEIGNQRTNIQQTMNPNGVDGDVRMWYHITCVYNGGPVGYWRPSTRSESEEELIQNIKDSFNFYQTNLLTGKVHEIKWYHIQATNKHDYLGFIQGVGYRGDRQETGSTGTFFGAFCDGAQNAFVFKSNWGGTWVTNTALSHSDLQGDTSETKASQPFRVNGFAMDPLGWATKYNKDATNTWIWSPSHHRNRTLNANKDQYHNITSGASTSNDLRALADMKDADRFYTMSDNSFWANNYPEDST